MWKKALKVLAYAIAGIAGILMILFLIYVIKFYPRTADAFEITTADPERNILIATQETEFKDLLVSTLCDSLEGSQTYISVIDVRNLDEVAEEDWDKILIMTSFVIKLNRRVERFASRIMNPENSLLYVTSGGADWQAKEDLKVDAITSASRMGFIPGLTDLVEEWIDSDENTQWIPGDYLLALIYFPRVDVSKACEVIHTEREKYMSAYPELCNMVNHAGYQFLRLDDVHSALKIFQLNTSLFPESWNVFDSYAEALYANGDKKAARLNYEKALELNPESSSTRRRLQKIKPVE